MSSRFQSKLEQIQTTLEDMTELREVPVFIHRDDDIIQAVNAKVAKATGTGVVMLKWLGGKNPDRKSSSLRMGARYSISLWTKKVLGDANNMPADELIELIGETLHGWVDPRVGYPVLRLEVESINLVPDAPGYIVHEILAEFSRI